MASKVESADVMYDPIFGGKMAVKLVSSSMRLLWTRHVYASEQQATSHRLDDRPNSYTILITIYSLLYMYVPIRCDFRRGEKKRENELKQGTSFAGFTRAAMLGNFQGVFPILFFMYVSMIFANLFSALLSIHIFYLHGNLAFSNV